MRPVPNNSRRIRRYLSILCALLGLALLLLATFNLLVDPFNVFRVLNWGDATKFKAANGMRPAKAEAVFRGNFDTIIIGSSRVEIGLSPDNPAWGTSRVYNCGLPGTCLDELADAVRLSLKNPSVRHIVLCLDMDDFEPNPYANDEYSLSRFNPDMNLAEYRLEHLFSLVTTNQSIGSIKLLLRREPCDHTPAGVMVRHLKPPTRKNWLAYLDQRDKLFTVANTESPVEHYRKPMDRLRQLLDLTVASHRSVTIVVLPSHAWRWQALVGQGKWELLHAWLRELTLTVADFNATQSRFAVPLWTFIQFAPENQEPVPADNAGALDMKWYWDPNHFKIALGDMVIARINGGQGNFGSLLTQDNVETYLAKLRVDQQRYAVGR